jgi:glutathione S-transferase
LEYLSVEEARRRSGLRLALTRGVPGPWSEAAKAMFTLRNVSFLPVQQIAGDDNAALVEWTGHRNAPIALYENEPPRVRWLELLDLAERLGTGPSLMPENRDDRVFMVGLINEIAGENGMAWNARILMFHATVDALGPDAANNPMYAEYRYDKNAIDSSIEKIESFLSYLASHMEAQRNVGTHFLVGRAFSAADVYWAYFSNMLKTLPQEQCPVSDGLRRTWGVLAKSISGYAPILIEQRNRIFAEHLELPLNF